MTNTKADNLAEIMEKKLIDGVYGESGERFLTLRELAKKKKFSLVTAQKTADILRKNGLLFLFEKSYYITVGIISESSDMFNAIMKKTKSLSKKPKIGIHFPKINNDFFSYLLKEVISAAGKSGFTPIIMISENSASNEKEILRDFISMGVLGVITCPNDDSLKRIYEIYPLPVVYIASGCSFTKENYVSVNESDAALHVAQHLIDMGYKKFIYIGLEQNSDTDYRQKAFVDALKEQNINMTSDDIIRLPQEENMPISHLLIEKIKKETEPVGVFCYHDMIAIKLLTLCKKNNLKIPQNLGVVGFDNLPIASKYMPALSTIAYRFDKMAASAVNKLETAINNRSAYDKLPVLVDHILYRRESSSRIK